MGERLQRTENFFKSPTFDQRIDNDWANAEPSHVPYAYGWWSQLVAATIGWAFGKPSSSIYFQLAAHGGIRPMPRRRSRNVGKKDLWQDYGRCG
jgi:hypothetical protein